MASQKLFRQVLVLLAVAMIPAGGAAFFHPKRPAWNDSLPGPGQVLLQTALGWKNQVLWLDARPDVEYQQAHIPGAMPLNEDDWDGLLPPVLAAWSNDRIIVVYCSSLSCQASEEVAKRLREDARLPQVYVLKGGWEAWIAGKK